MKNPAMKELIQEKLHDELDIESLYEKERIHAVCENITHKKRYSR